MVCHVFQRLTTIDIVTKGFVRLVIRPRALIGSVDALSDFTPCVWTGHFAFCLSRHAF